MKQSFYLKLTLLFMIVGMISSCKGTKEQQDNYANILTFKPGEEAKIEEAFLSIKDSTSILLQAGNYKFDNLSIVQVKHILIHGEGHDKTILNFSSQTQGGEGIRVTDVKGFTIENMTIRDSKGDLLKISNSSDVKVANLHALWSQADSTSGGYAIYPVLCKNVLVENCYTEGSSDAGIYVGQTDGAIVRNCKAAKNVAGCEIENTSNAEVYNNEFYNNTAGFLIFDLPDLSKRGGKVKVYNNNIYDNNFRNFAKSGSFGTSWGAGNASPGSGIIILAASDIEIYDNKITGNNTAAITIASGFATDEKAAEKINANYSPISKNIKIHSNKLEMGPEFPKPAFEHRIGQVLVATQEQLNKLDPNRKFKRIPLIVYDGFSSNVLTKGTALNPDSICINQPEENLFVNADFQNVAKPENWKPNTDSAPFQCK